MGQAVALYCTVHIFQVFDANFQINEFPTIKTKHENNEQIRV
jgi:hypothetical protein